MNSPPNIILPSLSDINIALPTAAVITTRNPSPPPTNIDTTTTSLPQILYSTNGRAAGVLYSTNRASTTANGVPIVTTITCSSIPTINSTSSSSATSSSPLRNTPPFNSSSISITNGLTPQPPLPSSTPTAAPSPPTSPFDNMLTQIDNFFKAAAIVASKKSGTNIGVVSCRYSINFLQNNVKDFIYLPKDQEPLTRLLAPFLYKSRIVMAVFNIIDKKVGYFDSLKELPSPDYFLVKYSVEKAMNSIHFDTTPQDSINPTINDNADPLLANFHICRIAEEICFNGKNRLLKPFVLLDEKERIKKILLLVSDPAWNGEEWISTAKDKRVENIIQDVIMGTAGTSSTSSSVTIVNGENVCTSSSGDSTCNKASGGNANVQAGGVGAAQQKSVDKDNDDAVRKRTIDALKKKLSVAQSTMDVYEKKYPVLTKMLQTYLSFTKARFDIYKRNERECVIKTCFKYEEFIKMNHRDTEYIFKMFTSFPYFSELKDSDKSILVKRFREPFLLFERIYDTWNAVGSELDDRHVMLQNGDCYNFDTLCRAEMPANMLRGFKIVFATWSTVNPMIRMIKPDILEAVYVFCCFLWNTSYLDTPISEDGNEIIHRGRLIIHKEMREFYNYDEEQWERIYLLRHLLMITEKAVKEYKGC